MGEKKVPCPSFLFFFYFFAINRRQLDTQILFHHTPADGVVEFLVLGKGLQGKAAINLVQGAEQGSNKLHAADLSEQIGGLLVAGAVVGLEGDLEVGKLELNVLGV